eukprot:Skav219098  [mRNA]  locus=scaffold1574:169120:175693:- [translate_table: standard]
MFKLSLPASLEVLHTSISCEACGIPKSDWSLHTEFILESSQRGSCVVGPIAPRASGQAILEKHADDGHHRKSSICKFGT